ncbi:energy-coupling factor transporter transmembrane component T family protein [Myxacorys almedinensis]|uniref:Cobalt transport protein n=1 Tax=Myxacorys almedinensis A TaxID=2690445 RepID=A0A8J7Z3V6_9CYAN|nr:CbiQ family ECF transporter T component [Myxacorys almedinensis]NDJ19492.1 hypothetical protein [Myxacorys almedinensis A]
MDLLRSLPLGLYLETPVTWLHKLDPRVKLAWLMSFLAAPLLATATWRLILVGGLILLTLVAQIPLRVWRQQMGWLLFLAVYVFALIAIAPDGLGISAQPRLPANELAFVQQSNTPPIPPPRPPWYNPWNFGQNPDPAQQAAVAALKRPELPQPTQYSYIVFQRGLLKVSRRSLDLAIRVSTLLFTVIYSTTLYLLTTAPEEITAGLEDLMNPLRRFKVPVTEIALTLTLSLRFIPLVMEEFQNLVRSVRTRAINWRKLGFRRTTQIWMLVAERLLENLLLRAEQIANAMKVRGFTSPDRHRVLWHDLKLRRYDWVALVVLGLLWAVRMGFSQLGSG